MRGLKMRTAGRQYPALADSRVARLTSDGSGGSCGLPTRRLGGPWRNQAAHMRRVIRGSRGAKRGAPVACDSRALASRVVVGSGRLLSCVRRAREA